MITLLLSDENMPAKSQQYLEDVGYDIKYITGELAGIIDDEVMKIALKENRIIVTFDSDFGELVERFTHTPNFELGPLHDDCVSKILI